MHQSPSTPKSLDELLTPELAAEIQAAPFEKVLDYWQPIIEDAGDAGIAWLGRHDRFFLLTFLLHREDAFHPWLYARTREVEAEPDGCLDLWAREHYKSTIITFAGIVQEILKDPEITIGIFSHVKKLSRDFLAQIKREFESNTDLKRVYPDVLYADPAREAPQWSIDGGIIVKRRSNPAAATVEGHGLTDGMPTGKHYRLLVYDDVVTRESVNTPEQVKKTTECWELSDNLGARDPLTGLIRKWHIGTRYSFADTYQDIITKGVLKVRIHAATDNGLASGKPVFLSDKAWALKKATMSDAILAAQMLQNPAAGQQAMFRKDWLRFSDIRPGTLNVYIMGDPASSKKKDSDNTAFSVVGIDAAGNKFLLDGFRHKMSLSERWDALYGLVKVWRAMPGVQMVRVGYEKYGMQSDIEYFEERMERLRDSFEIVELNWVKDTPQAKDDRVQRLQPDFKAGKFFLAQVCVREVVDAHGIKQRVPYETDNQRKVKEGGQAFRIFTPIRRRDHEGNIYSLNKGFLDEYLTYPFSSKKDLIDATSRFYDMDPVPPILVAESDLEAETFVDGI